MVSFPFYDSIVVLMYLICLALWAGNNLERWRLKKKITIRTGSPFFVRMCVGMHLGRLTNRALRNLPVLYEDWLVALRTCSWNVGHVIYPKTPTEVSIRAVRWMTIVRPFLELAGKIKPPKMAEYSRIIEKYSKPHFFERCYPGFWPVCCPNSRVLSWQ